MSEPIKPGDLCVVVHDCCGGHLGRIFVVDYIYSRNSFLRCDYCGWQSGTGVIVWVVGFGAPEKMLYPLAWLKKIPPLTEDEAIEREAETVT